MQTILQTQVTPTNEVTHYYGYDGHGTVRFLLDSNGGITDTYDYDLPSPQGFGQTGAFGNIISRSGTTVNHLQYCGEYLDPDLGLYFLRARYMDTDRGRFWTMDPFRGLRDDPRSLHWYLYCVNDPVGLIDPRGTIFYLSNFTYGNAVHDAVGAHFEAPSYRVYDWYINHILGTSGPLGWTARPDLVDMTPGINEVYEIKPWGSVPAALKQLGYYLVLLNSLDPEGRTWVPGVTYAPPAVLDLGGGVHAILSRPMSGVIIYHVCDWKEAAAVGALAAVRMASEIMADLAMAVLRSRLAPAVL